jgi:hypothetical protein
MADLFFPEVEVNQRATAFGLGIMPASFSEGFEAAFEETTTRNPVPSLLRSMDRARYREGRYVDEFGNEQITPAEPSRILSPEEANAQYGVKGRLTFDAPTPEPVAKSLNQLKVREIELQDVRRRANSGLGTALTAGVLGSLLDPLNIGLAFVPVVGPARQAAIAARIGVGGGRAATGAIEGAVGAALIEPLVLGVAMEEQADYTAVDSVANLVFGSALGAGLHFGAGFVGDRVKARTEAPPLAKAIDDLPHQDQAALLRTAVAQAVEGRPVDIAAVFDVAVASRTAAQEDADFIAGLRREWAREVDNELARFTGDRGAGLPPTLAEDSPLAQLIARVADQTDRALQGPLSERVKSLEPDLKSVFPQPEPKAGPPLTPAQRLKAAVAEMQADPAKIFEAAKSKPEIFQTLAKALDETNQALASPDAAPPRSVTDVRPEQQAAVQEAVARAQEPHVDKADSDGAAVAEQRVTEEATIKDIDDEVTRVQEEVTELESYAPDNIEPSQAVRDAAKEATLYEKAWRAAAACVMRKS